MRYLPDAKQMKTADSFTINELKNPVPGTYGTAARACVITLKTGKLI